MITINVFVHGLGQRPATWQDTISHMNGQIADSVPLFKLVTGDMVYANLYSAFVDYMKKFDEPVNLCGLSLGAILALNYVIDYPKAVKSLVLIGGQYRMPKKSLKFQNTVFKLMPKKLFENMGITKDDCIKLTNSMADLDFSKGLKEISCPVLVICGEKDNANKAAAMEMTEQIDKARFQVAESVGHEVNVCAPIMLAEMLTEFYGGN